MLAVQAAGKQLETIEGLQRGDLLHPIQEAFIESGAVHCGFCTPGFILTAKAFLEQNHSPSEAEIREAISGNLCRCTGYVQIVDAIRLAAKKMYPHGE
jgi:carbon-monoxide dehydrogenase small subunit